MELMNKYVILNVKWIQDNILTFLSLVNSEPNAQSKRAVFSADVLIEANRVPSCAQALWNEGSALTVWDPTLLPLSSVILKHEEPIDAIQVYPGGHLGARAVQKYGLPWLHIAVFHLKLGRIKFVSATNIHVLIILRKIMKCYSLWNFLWLFLYYSCSLDR